MGCFKKLYGKTTIDSSDSDELNKEYEMELEYYQLENSTSKHQYGIEIIKKEKIKNQLNIEKKMINNICNKEQETTKLLELLMINKVTPISVDDILQDLSKAKAI